MNIFGKSIGWEKDFAPDRLETIAFWRFGFQVQFLSCAEKIMAVHGSVLFEATPFGAVLERNQHTTVFLCLIVSQFLKGRSH